jgi:parvulin-like peptidyl-prolyl isomerase
MELEPGGWEGPVLSGYGLHLVKVRRIDPGFIPQWESIRDELINDMQYEARLAAREQFYQEILRSYRVILEGEVRRVLESIER